WPRGLLLENPKGNKGKPDAVPRYLRSNQGIPRYWIQHSGEKPQTGSNTSGIPDPIPPEGWIQWKRNDGSNGPDSAHAAGQVRSHGSMGLGNRPHYPSSQGWLGRPEQSPAAHVGK